MGNHNSLIYCPKCSTKKVSELFGSNKSTKSGKNGYCKECVRRISKERRGYHNEWREKNREHSNAKIREWCAKNPERKKEISKKSDQKNRGRKAKRVHEYYLANKEKYREWAKNTSPEIRRAIKRRYLDNKAKALNIPYKRKDILSKHQNVCAYCSGFANALDHVIPLSKGGADAEFNLVASCIPCNAEKGSKYLHEWLRGARI